MAISVADENAEVKPVQALYDVLPAVAATRSSTATP
jgi:hypothetical protein